MHTIDTHSHFNLEQFAADRAEAIDRMINAGVGTITIGIDLPTSVLALSIATMYEGIWACVGQHPTEWQKEFVVKDFAQLADHKKVVAIGECGLDYYRPEDRAGETQQKILFAEHIALAKEYNLPLMLHIRPQQGAMDAYEDALVMLEEAQKVQLAAGLTPLRGTAHFFVGNTAIADRFLALGFYISFSGVITFASEYEQVVRHVPLHRILSETDAPFVSPVPHRGKRNEPAYVVAVVEKVAEIKGVSVEEARVQLLQNTQDLFVL